MLQLTDSDKSSSKSLDSKTSSSPSHSALEGYSQSNIPTILGLASLDSAPLATGPARQPLRDSVASQNTVGVSASGKVGVNNNPIDDKRFDLNINQMLPT